MCKRRTSPNQLGKTEQLIISLSVSVFDTGKWTIEQGLFTKLQYGHMQPANTTQLLYLGSLKFIWGRPLCLDQDLVN